MTTTDRRSDSSSEQSAGPVAAARVPTAGWYFEDFVVGDVVRHARGKTVTAVENVTLTNRVMNTAQGHFNEDSRVGQNFPHILVFGGITTAMVIGLATQDTAQNAVAELGLDGIRLLAPVTHGDTLYSYTEVLDTQPSEHPDAGVVTFAHFGANQRGECVFEGRRRVLVKRKDAR